MPTAATTRPASSGLPSSLGRRRLLLRLALGYAVALALMVLTPISHLLLELTVAVGDGWSATGLPGDTGVPIVGAALNVVLFVPLGWALVALTRRPWWVAALIAIGVSGCVELVQLLPALDRDSSLADVVSNGLGGLCGAALATARRRAPVVRIPQQARPPHGGATADTADRSATAVRRA